MIFFCKTPFKSATCIVTIVVFTLHTHAQTTGSLMLATRELNNIAKNRIDQFNTNMSQQQRDFFANAYNFSSVLMDELEDQIDDLDDKLSAQQRAAFTDIERLLSDANKPLDKLVVKSEDISLLMANAMVNIIGSDDKPAPYFYQIPNLSTSQEKILTIIIKGINLDHEDNYIVFKGKKITEKSIKSPQEVAFRVTLTKDDMFDPFALNTFDVHLFEDSYIFWEAEYIYNPRFIVLPGKLADAEITYYETHEIREEHPTEYSSYVDKRTSSNSVKGNPKTFSIPHERREAGWKIIQGSPRQIKGAESGGDEHYCQGPRNETEFSFEVEAKTRDGYCVCYVYWKEYRKKDVDSLKTYKTQIYFGPNRVIPLDDKFKSLIQIKLVYPDGDVMVSGKNSHSYRNVSYHLYGNDRKFEIGYSE